jgi:hypothetical protein
MVRKSLANRFKLSQEVSELDFVPKKYLMLNIPEVSSEMHTMNGNRSVLVSFMEVI